jgi:hypothetical protein
MTARVIIHIGLHKTGTRFLRRRVFEQLDPDDFIYNPGWLITPLRRAVRYRDQPETAKDLEAAVTAWRESDNQRTLVLSEPHAGGDMYGMHEGCDINAALLRRVFPEAIIIYFVREHASWLQSAYRQSLVKDPGQSIQRFLNFYDGAFHGRPARRVAGNRNVEALGHDFLGIYHAYARQFGTDRVYLLRQESLRDRTEAVEARVAEALGMHKLPPPPASTSANRSFSALAIMLFFPGVWLRRRRPPVTSDTGTSAWRSRLNVLRKLRTNFIRHVFDRLIYIDWDLLQADDMRRRIEAHYQDEQRRLREIAEAILDEGPSAVDEEPCQPPGASATVPLDQATPDASRGYGETNAR